MAAEDLDRAARLAQLGRQIAAVGPDGRPGPTVSETDTGSPSGGPAVVGGPPWSSDDEVGDRPDAASTTSDPVLTGLNRSPEHTRARDICLRLLAVMPRPRAKLRSELRKREIPDEIAEQVLDRLTELRYLDDAEYARTYVRAKHRDRALGRSALRQELRRQGVDPEDIAPAVDQVDDEDERARAEQWIAKKVRSALAAGEEAARRRLMGQLARRGYSYDVARPVVDAAIAACTDNAQVADDPGSP